MPLQPGETRVIIKKIANQLFDKIMLVVNTNYVLQPSNFGVLRLATEMRILISPFANCNIHSPKNGLHFFFSAHSSI